MSKKEINKEQKIIDITKNGDELAKEAGYDGIEEFVADLNSKLDVKASTFQKQGMDKNEAAMKVGEIQNKVYARAAEFVANLIAKTFRQEVLKMSELTHLRWATNFRTEYINEGNGIDFFINLMSGVDTLDMNKYIPDFATTPKALQDNASFFEQNGVNKTLAEGAYQYKDRFSDQKVLWKNAFRTEALQEFVAERVALLKNKFDIYLADNFIRKIVGQARLAVNKATVLNNASKRFPLVEGQGANLFTAFHELRQVILDMKKADIKYLYGTDPDLAAAPQSVDTNDLLVIMSEKTRALMYSGIKSQLYNNGLWGLSDIIPDENIITLGNEYNFPNAFQYNNEGVGAGMTLTWKKTPGDINTLSKQINKKYLGDNENFIIIIDKSKVMNLFYLEEHVSQFFANNLTLETFIHIWGQNYISPLTMCCVYHNPNLNVMPDEIQP